jgi:hypothetical protein
MNTSYQNILPVNRFELWIVRIWCILGAIAIGGCIALWMTRNDFSRGMDYMQEVTGREYQKNVAILGGKR